MNTSDDYPLVDNLRDLVRPIETVVLTGGERAWSAHAVREMFGLPEQVIEAAGGVAIPAMTDAGEEVSVYREGDLFKAMMKLNKSPTLWGCMAIPVVIMVYAADWHRCGAEQGDDKTTLELVALDMMAGMTEDRLSVLKHAYRTGWRE